MFADEHAVMSPASSGAGAAAVGGDVLAAVRALAPDISDEEISAILAEGIDE
jgi:hypothetical protein